MYLPHSSLQIQRPSTPSQFSLRFPRESLQPCGDKVKSNLSFAVTFIFLSSSCQKKKKNLQTRMRHFIYQNGICLASEAEDVKFLQNFILVLEIQFQTMISFSLLPWAVEELKQRWYFVFPLNMKVKKRNWQFCYPKSKS